MPKTKPPIDEVVEDLEAQVFRALIERLPELKPFVVNPESVTYFERDVPVEAWVVARSGATVMFIGIEPEKFGVGFLGRDRELENVTLYPTPELAVRPFIAAIGHDI